MITALAAHLWASTLFLALLLAVVAVARKRLTATARFWLVLIGIAWPLNEKASNSVGSRPSVV